MFVGFSPTHSSVVSLVLNVQTGKISPQYHVAFDNTFTTVNSLPSNKPLDTQWSQIFKLDREFYLDLEYNQDGQLKTSHFPNLDSAWLDMMSPNTTGVRSPGGAPDVNAAPGGAEPLIHHFDAYQGWTSTRRADGGKLLLQ